MDLDERTEKKIRLIHEMELLINGTDEDFQAEWEKFLENMLEIYPERLTGNKAKFTDEERAIAKREWDICFALVKKRSDERMVKLKREIAELKEQRKQQEREIEEQTAKITELEARLYSEYPSNTATWLSKQIVNSPHRATHSKIKVREYEKEQKRIFSYRASSSSGEVSLTLNKVKELFNRRIQNGVKIFSFFTRKLDEQNYAEETYFDLHELVDLGIYKTLRSAYKGVTKAVIKFMEIQINGTYFDYVGKKRIEKANKGGPLISWREITFNRCYIKFPPIFRDRKPQITILPDWAYSLSDNAFMLVDYIFYLARTNRETSFNVNLDTVRGHLGYPSVEDVKENHKSDYNKLIVESMQEVIAEVLEATKAKGQQDIKIKQVYDSRKVQIKERSVTVDRVEDYLDGYIHLEITGEPAIFIEARAKDAAHEKKAEEGRINRAIARKIAKKKPDSDADSDAKKD